MTDTPERARQTDFVDYFSAGTSIVVPRGNPAGVTGSGIGAARSSRWRGDDAGGPAGGRAQRNCPGKSIDVQTYPTNSDADVLERWDVSDGAIDRVRINVSR